MVDNGEPTSEHAIVGRILEAVEFAALKHKSQRRKDPERTPYINHPIGVAYILWKEGGVHDSSVIQVLTDQNQREIIGNSFLQSISIHKHNRFGSLIWFMRSSIAMDCYRWASKTPFQV